MIKLPNLDDQKYSDIVEAAKRRIPVIFPEWTDFNEHDPGITVVEVFAWLKEMQQYYMNRISDKSRENMLRLLGIEMLPAAPAEVLVSFSGEAPERLVQGVSVRTANGTEFVTTEEYRTAPFKLGRMYFENGNTFIDVSDLAYDEGTAFYPFGGQLDCGERNFYLEISEICSDRFFDGIELMFDIFDKLPVQRNAADTSVPPPRNIVWEYSTANGFVPCEVLSDSTYALSFSGGITLKIGLNAAPYGNKELPNSIWVRAKLISSGCEDMPQLQRIYCGGLKLTQKTRLAAAEDIILNGKTAVKVDDMLAANGVCFAFVRDKNGWLFDENAVIVKTAEGAMIDISAAADTIAEDGEPNVRIVRCEESFGRNKMFFSSDGLPCQQFEFDPDGEVLCGELRVMVKDRESDEFPRWNEYGYISSLSLAGAYDRCFTYDEERRALIFGDNEHGEVPSPGDENIIVMSCSVTKGKEGNIMSGNLESLSVFGKTYTFDRSADSIGGRSRESLTHALGRLKARMNERKRAVTADDYRTAALRTPGLRIADATAIPFFDPELLEVSEDKAPNTVTVVVLPYSAERFPMPDGRFVAAVKEYLENYRLITTKVSVTAPIYVRVDIFVEVICTTREVEQACSRIRSELSGMFSVYGLNGRTRFGEPVTEADIIACICAVDEILSVKQLRVRADDNRCSRDRYGRIVIPPNAVAYCGSVRIDVADS